MVGGGELGDGGGWWKLFHRFYKRSLRIKASSVTETRYSTLFPHFPPLLLIVSLPGNVLELGAMQNEGGAEQSVTPGMDAIRLVVVVVFSKNFLHYFYSVSSNKEGREPTFTAAGFASGTDTFNLLYSLIFIFFTGLDASRVISCSASIGLQWSSASAGVA